MGATTNSTEKKSEKEIMREQKRTVDRAQRKVEREIKNIQRNEQKQLKEVENLARKGQHDAARIVAKTVAMTRGQIKNYYNMSA